MSLAGHELDKLGKRQAGDGVTVGQTYELIRVLLEAYGGNEVGALVGGPFRYYGLRQPVGAIPMTVGGGCVLGGGRAFGVGRGDLRIGCEDGGAGVETPLVLVISVGFRVGSAGVEIHGGESDYRLSVSSLCPSVRPTFRLSVYPSTRLSVRILIG